MSGVNSLSICVLLLLKYYRSASSKLAVLCLVAVMMHSETAVDSHVHPPRNPTKIFPILAIPPTANWPRVGLSQMRLHCALQRPPVSMLRRPGRLICAQLQPRLTA